MNGDAGPVVDVSDPWAMVPEWVVNTVGPRALQVYVVLRLHASYQTGETWVSATTIAERLGVTTKTVRRALHDLVEAGAVRVRPRYGDDGQQRSNIYEVGRRFDVPVVVDEDTIVHGGGQESPGAMDTDDQGPRTPVSTITRLSERDSVNEPSARRPGDDLWDRLTEVLGPPTATMRTLQGRLVAELVAAGIDSEHLDRIMARMVAAWGPTRLTLASLAKHWSRWSDAAAAAAPHLDVRAAVVDRETRLRAAIDEGRTP